MSLTAIHEGPKLINFYQPVMEKKVSYVLLFILHTISNKHGGFKNCIFLSDNI